MKRFNSLNVQKYSMSNYLIYMVLLMPCLLCAQTKKDNTIIVKGVSYSQVKNMLLDSGYFLTDQSAEDGTLITKERSADKGHMFGQKLDRWHYIIYVRVKDSTAIFQAQWDYTSRHTNAFTGMQTTSNAFQEASYHESEDSEPGKVFFILIKEVTALGGQIAYEKR